MKCLTFKLLTLNYKLVLEEGKIKTEMTLVIPPDVQDTQDTRPSRVLTGAAEDVRVGMYKLPMEGD